MVIKTICIKCGTEMKKEGNVVSCPECWKEPSIKHGVSWGK